MGNKRSSVASLRRVICEAVNDAVAESQLEAGFAKALAPAIEAATEQLMDAIGMAAESKRVWASRNKIANVTAAATGADRIVIGVNHGDA